LEDFETHVGNDFGAWKDVIAQHGEADVNDKRGLMLQLRGDNALQCIMNTFLQHRDLHKRSRWRY